MHHIESSKSEDEIGHVSTESNMTEFNSIEEHEGHFVLQLCFFTCIYSFDLLFILCFGGVTLAFVFGILTFTYLHCLSSALFYSHITYIIKKTTMYKWFDFDNHCIVILTIIIL